MRRIQEASRTSSPKRERDPEIRIRTFVGEEDTTSLSIFLTFQRKIRLSVRKRRSDKRPRGETTSEVEVATRLSSGHFMARDLIRVSFCVRL